MKHLFLALSLLISIACKSQVLMKGDTVRAYYPCLVKEGDDMMVKISDNQRMLYTPRLDGPLLPCPVLKKPAFEIIPEPKPIPKIWSVQEREIQELRKEVDSLKAHVTKLESLANQVMIASPAQDFTHHPEYQEAFLRYVAFIHNRQYDMKIPADRKAYRKRRREILQAWHERENREVGL